MVDAADLFLPRERWGELLSPSIQPPRLRLKLHEAELWIAEETTGQLVWVNNPYLPNLGIWAANAREDQVFAAMVTAADIPPGTRVRLVHETDTGFDSHAVAIMADDLMLGYWRKQAGRALAAELDAGIELEAVILAGSPSGKKAERVRVLAAAPELVAHLEGRRVGPSEERPSLLRRLLGRTR